MLPALERIKGIHPGAVLRREIKRRGIKNIELANAINEHPQTLNAIAKARRGINAKLSVKLGEYFNIAPEYFMYLQAAYEVGEIQLSEIKDNNPILGKYRKAIFWDTRIESLDFQKHKRFIIQRVLERGNEKEIRQLIKMYSLEEIKREMPPMETAFVPKYKENVLKYILQKE
jgi:addiction module HigA family antidote